MFYKDTQIKQVNHSQYLSCQKMWHRDKEQKQHNKNSTHFEATTNTNNKHCKDNNIPCLFISHINSDWKFIPSAIHSLTLRLSHSPSASLSHSLNSFLPLPTHPHSHLILPQQTKKDVSYINPIPIIYMLLQACVTIHLHSPSSRPILNNLRATINTKEKYTVLSINFNSFYNALFNPQANNEV